MTQGRAIRAKRGLLCARLKRNSLSGKNTHLPRRLVRDGREPAHIGEALLQCAEGNPEGSPRDPLTTDPKGEACRAPVAPEIQATCNTPALIDRQGAYGVVSTLDPWYVTGLTEGEGCFCISFAVRAKLRTGLEVRPSFSLSLNERDLGLLRDLQAFFVVAGSASRRIARSSTRCDRSTTSRERSCPTLNVSSQRTRGEELCSLRLSVPDG